MLNNNNILVLIQLIGGNDGLNTTIPLKSYANLTKHRSNILIPENKLLNSGEVGFHPVIKNLFDLYQNGEMTIVNNVGYPLPNRSHFRSMDIWNSGSPSDKQWNTGWLGRLLDFYHSEFPTGYPNAKFPDPLAITLGNIASDTCQGKYYNFSHVVDNLNSFTVVNNCVVSGLSNHASNELMSYLNSTISLTNLYTKQIERAAAKGNSLAIYPVDSQLAEELKITARLISGGLQTKIYLLSLNGFDTHAYQTSKDDTSRGMHASLLKLLSEAISAFINDLKRLGCYNRVNIMTYSEFGRQIKSNSASGTDHGDASSVYLFGNYLKQPVIGHFPEINEEVAPQAGLKMETDFRNLYSSVIKDWFSVPEKTATNLFDTPFTPYQIFKT